MLGILIEYQYDGDEEEWQQVTSEFIKRVATDDKLDGKFQYAVFKDKEGSGRTHIGRWDIPETVQYLQKTDYFADFSGIIKQWAGDTLKNRGLVLHDSTS